MFDLYPSVYHIQQSFISIVSFNTAGPIEIALVSASQSIKVQIDANFANCQTHY